MNQARTEAVGWRYFLAIALVSLSIIVLEIALTRILSVILWYHWAFLCISLTMLGIGAPGVWFSLVRNPSRWLRPLLLVAAILIPASVISIFQLGQLLQENTVSLTIASILPPMLALGGAICVLLLMAPGPTVGRMYGFDLLGACLGGILIIPLMSVIPTPHLVAGAGLLPLAAFVLVSRRIWPWVGLLAAACLVGLIVWGRPFELHYNKAFVETGIKKPLYEAWTPTSRIMFFGSGYFPTPRLLWGKGTKAASVYHDHCWVEQDGCAGMPIIQYDGDPNKVRFLFDDVTTVGYQLRPPKTVAIVGAGGGRDILSAKVAGAQQIDAVEMNKAIVKTISDRFRQFSGDVYHLPGVQAVVSEGRSFLTRSKKDYDFIQISMIDSWAATTAGAFTLSENNLYTVEAYRTYWRHLSPTGIISTTRWIAGRYHVELPRLLLLVKHTLAAEGMADVNQHLAVIQGEGIGTVLVSKSPLSFHDIDELIRICVQRGFTLHYPGSAIQPADSVPAQVVTGGTSWYDRLRLNLKPPVDDKPFFFLVLSPFRRYTQQIIDELGDSCNVNAILALQKLILATASLAVLLFFLPLPLGRWVSFRSGFFRGSSFFALIGGAFMLVEIPFIQRFILYLGHPSYATSVVLVAILLGASLGAMSSARIGLARIQRFGFVLPLALAAANASMAALFSATLGAALWARILISTVLLLPVSFLMGLFFPSGMVRFGDTNKAWFWAINGVVGVMASVLSLALSIEFGFSGVAYMGIGLYVLAWLSLQGRAVPLDAATS